MPTKDWPHAPVHRLSSHGIYMVTGATLHKEKLFSSDEKLCLLENNLLTLARKYQWQLKAWAAFVNHYHFVGRGHPDASPLDEFLKHLHSDTARNLNRIDQSPGRRSLVQLLGHQTHIRALLSGSTKLRSPERRKTPTRQRR